MVEGCRVHVLGILPRTEIHHADLEVGEDFLDAPPVSILSAASLEQSSCNKHVLLAIEFFVGDLSRFQGNRSARHEDRTDQTDRNGDQQDVLDRVSRLRHYAPSSA